jgi:hypothetical protein
MSNNVGLLGPLADPKDAVVEYDHLPKPLRNANMRSSIVFIHGLTGHRENTWTKHNFFWPKAILPSDVPKARIWSWGYDADILHFWKKRSKPGLNGHSQQLCSDLAGVRTGTVRLDIQMSCSPFRLLTTEAGPSHHIRSAQPRGYYL